MIFLVLSMTGCNESETASFDLDKKATNFEMVRRVILFDSLQGSTLVQMTGRLSCSIDGYDSTLSVMVQMNDGSYSKYHIGLGDNVTYIVEDLHLTEEEVKSYEFEIEYNPNIWLPE